MASIAVPYDESFEGLAPAPILRDYRPSSPLVFVIPAYNEADNLPRLFADLEARPALFPAGSRVIVVDDGSVDGTGEIVERYQGPLPIELVRLDRNRGPGAAFRAGFAAALRTCSDEAFVVTLEADTTSNLDYLPEMLARAAAGAELVLASWVMLNVSRLRRFLSASAAVTMRLGLGLDAHTVSSFFRVYRAGTLRAAHERWGDDLMRESGFACKAELLAKLAAAGARIEEVAVGLDTSRRIGPSKMPFLRTIVGYWRVLVRQRLTRAGASA